MTGENRILKIMSLSFTGLMLLTLILLVFVSPGMEYFLKPDIGVSNLKLLITGVILTGIVMSVLSLSDRALPAPGKLPLIIVSSILLFIAEVIYSVSAFFYSDWDPAGILDCVYKLLRGTPDGISLDYFSAHPNNLMLVFIYLTLLRAGALFGTETVLILVIFQALLFTLSGVLVFYILSDVFSVKTGYVSWLIFAFWIGLDPYILITYSDAVGLIFPLISLRLFQIMIKDGISGRKRLILSVLLGITAAFGYSVKPQTVIMYIAVCLVLLLKTVFIKKRELLTAVILSAAGLIITTFLINGLFYPSLKLDLNKDKSFGFAHYIMMGLNPETDGVYSNEDTELTNGIADPKERRDKNLEIAGERIRAYGLKGMAGHLVRKQLINFGDGTFSWGIDGNFFAGSTLGDMPEVKEDSPLRPFILSFIVMGEKNYSVFQIVMQLIWLTVLFFGTCGGVLLLGEKKNTDLLTVICLSITGLTLFELIFEAKARYLFTFTPVFLLAGIYGAHGLYLLLRNRIPSLKEHR